MAYNNGRPAQSGPRYPCGKLKPPSRGEAAHNRLKHAPLGVQRLFDPQLASALGRLSPDFMNELTWQQVEAGKAIGHIYGQYHRLAGFPSRSAASPSYQRSYSKAAEISAAELEARTHYAERRYVKLQEVIDALPISRADLARVRAIIEDLCVDDHQPATANLPGLRAVLSRVAMKLKVERRLADSAETG
jgi:hypothetical protein